MTAISAINSASGTTAEEFLLGLMIAIPLYLVFAWLSKGDDRE